MRFKADELGADGIIGQLQLKLSISTMVNGWRLPFLALLCAISIEPDYVAPREQEEDALARLSSPVMSRKTNNKPG